ncbi:hypothetical protein IWQ60_004814 [Tieghemiomyces parasiticus]|uniref:Uncharacterized protein n=1 Tax=Tieghemiomyces parasiticus TaxID=78921 RepID=A0A9W8A7G4_9FUNG|nr:hypothetical protein IWQ60_004814 [Tieghemiomyces parasiticus]
MSHPTPAPGRSIRGIRQTKALLQSVGPGARLRQWKTPQTVRTATRIATAGHGSSTSAPIWGTDWHFTPQAEFAKALVLKTWSLSLCTAWYDFRPELARTYASELRTYLQSELAMPTALLGQEPPVQPRNTGVAVASTGLVIPADGVRLHFVTDLDQPLGSFVYFSIRYSTVNTRGAKQSASALAVFTSLHDYGERWATGESPSASPSAPGTPLEFPLALFKGPVAVRSAFENWLQTRFDCRLQPWRLPRSLMTQVVSWWSWAWLDQLAELDVAERAVVITEDYKPFELHYQVPTSTKSLQKMVIALPVQSVVDIWIKSRSERPDYDPTDETRYELSVLDIVEAHFGANFHIRVDRFTPDLFGTGNACLTADGKLKFFSASYAEFSPFWLAQLCALTPHHQQEE